LADNFGLKIGVEGEKEFKNALRDINQAFKVLGSEMALVSSQFDKNDKSIQALTARNEVLEKSIDAQKEKIETLRAALDNASTSFGENDRRTQNWQIQLNKALAELNGMERELENNHKALRDHADATDDSADNMEDAADAANELADNVDDVGDEMDDASKKTSVFGDVLKANLLSEAIIGGVKALGSAIAGIGKAFIGAMKDGVEYNAQMENYTASFTTMLGDEAKAQKLVNDLKKEAAATPFGMQDLAQSAQTLMSFGMSAEEAQKRMKQLGDISQGDAEKFKSLTLAFAQMSSTGKLTGQDLMQMINAGFNPLEEISRKTGKSIGELKDEMSKGAISADMVAEAFASATSEGGRFYGSMEAQSKTFSGQMATLEDGVASLKGQLAEGLTTMLSGTVLPMVNGWVDELSGAFEKDGVQGLIDAFGGILEEAVQFISEQLPIVVDIASQIIISLVQGLTTALPQITEAAVMLLMTLVNGIIEEGVILSV
jgi:tape measure domain-containing protein